MLRKTLLLAIAILAITTAQAKIWRVNNTTGITANFTTAQAAHNGAAAGDTLHFEPSITSYGDLTMTKRLVLIGIGELLNITTSNQASSLVPYIGYLTINSGAANSVIMVNSTGITLTSAYNVTIQRCYVYVNDILVYDGDNLTIRSCYIDGQVSIASVTTNGSIGVIVNNNICSNKINVDVNSSADIINNIIGSSSTIYNSIVRNNIFRNGSTNNFFSTTVQNNLFSYVFFNNTGGTISNNQTGVSMNNTFVNGNSYSNVTADAGYQLKSGSPAIAAGVSGEDCGAFGGALPYKLAVQPPVPAIYKLVAPSSASNTLNVTISTKSNN